MISKEILQQRSDIEEEIKSTQVDIKKTEEAIERLVLQGTVKDKVYGGEGGIQSFVITGFPERAYNRRKKILEDKMARLIDKQTELMEINEEIEKLIDEIKISRDRRIFKGIYVENKTQQQVADELHIDRSLVSKIISKYF